MYDDDQIVGGSDWRNYMKNQVWRMFRTRMIFKYTCSERWNEQN